MAKKRKKMLFYLPILAVVAAIALFGGLSCASRRAPELGLREGKLRPCPESPNCVSSHAGDETHGIEPLRFEDDPDAAWERVRRTIETTGGDIREEREDYLWAVYTTSFLRFKDDLELHLDRGDGVIHVRSASRVGYSDLGVNRKRVERIRKAFSAK